VLFLDFVRYQQNHRQEVFNWGLLRLCMGIDILKFDITSIAL